MGAPSCWGEGCLSVFCTPPLLPFPFSQMYIFTLKRFSLPPPSFPFLSNDKKRQKEKDNVFKGKEKREEKEKEEGEK